MPHRSCSSRLASLTSSGFAIPEARRLLRLAPYGCARATSRSSVNSWRMTGAGMASRWCALAGSMSRQSPT